jgi:D-alanine-D-alanine ligase
VSRLAVVFGGPSPEHDVSILTGLLAARALAQAGREVQAIYWSKTAEWLAVDADLEAEAFVEGVPRGARPLRLVLGREGGFVAEGLGRRRPLALAAVVNCCHGGPGEDGGLQGALDLAGVPYTGPTVAGAALGMDKLAFAAVMQAEGLPHLPCALVDPAADPVPPFPGPYIVKPRFGGSSIGIEVVEDHESVLAFVRSPQPALRDGAVVEPYRAGGVDLQVAVRRHPALELSAIERPLRGGEVGILGYRDKYVAGEGMAGAARELPARIPEATEKLIREHASRIATLAGVRGIARIDFLADGDQVFVNEINTIPGSLSKHLWVEPEVPFETLLGDMVEEALGAPARRYSTSGADGSVLRSAGSIAGKLA